MVWGRVSESPPSRGWISKTRPVGTSLRLGSGPGGALSLTATNARHVVTDATSPTSANLKYRVPLAPALDGNTVDVQMEQAAFAENAVRYQSTLTFLTERFRGLITAITGQ